MSHGYSVTDYKSQGQTSKHVIYHADSSKGVNFNQAYVGITRGKQSIKIYTDSKEQLHSGINQERTKTSTLDYLDFNSSNERHKAMRYETTLSEFALE